MRLHSLLRLAPRIAAVTSLAATLSLGAQIPVQTLPAAEAATAASLGSIANVRELSDGSVLVNDAANRRLLLFARDLSSSRVLADNFGTTDIAYGATPTAVLPFRGDSSLFVDLVGRALVVLDPHGRQARVMSAPRPTDIGQLTVASLGVPTLDVRGRLIYRTSIPPKFALPVKGKRYESPSMPDSSPLLQVDFDTRRADTIAWIRSAKITTTSRSLSNGGVVLRPVVNPLQIIDDWAMLSDGTIAIMRGSEYRMEWIRPDGTRGVGERVPFAWRKLTDADKIAMIDSTRRAMSAQATGAVVVPGGAPAGGHGSQSAGGGGHSMTIMPLGAEDAGPEVREAAAKFANEPAEVVDYTALPDFYPSLLNGGTAVADRDGRLWVLPSIPSVAGPGLLYDVLDQSGALRERVRIPAGRSLQGFGRDGAVYLASYTKEGVALERVRVR